MQTISLAEVRAIGQGLRWFCIPRMTQGGFDHVADDDASMTASERGDALDEPVAQLGQVVTQSAESPRWLTQEMREPGGWAPGYTSMGRGASRRVGYATRGQTEPSVVVRVGVPLPGLPPHDAGTGQAFVFVSSPSWSLQNRCQLTKNSLLRWEIRAGDTPYRRARSDVFS